MQIRWTNHALTQLDEIFYYIAEDSPQNAQHFIDQLIGAADKIVDFPYSYRKVPEIKRDDVREVIYKGYRIIFWLANDELINIMGVESGLPDPLPINHRPWETQ